MAYTSSMKTWPRKIGTSAVSQPPERKLPKSTASMTLPLGLLLNAEYPIHELIETAKLGESLGYDQLWYTDVRFQRDCFVGLAALATNTQRILLGPGVTDPYSRHPVQTAATIASLDELSNGRALLGLGIGGAGFN